ncbi:hypothetical protein GGI18_002695, partial [Coemansia linderi]
ALKGRFSNATVLDKISAELDNLKQTGSITDYANRFQILAARLQLDDNEELRRKFARGLRTNGRVQLAMRDPPTLAESIRLAIRYELAYMGATAIPNRAAAPTRVVQRQIRDENAMDVDIMAADEGAEELDINAVQSAPRYHARNGERERCRAQGLCFRCKQHGHRSFECPDRLNAQQ